MRLEKLCKRVNEGGSKSPLFGVLIVRGKALVATLEAKFLVAAEQHGEVVLRKAFD